MINNIRDRNLAQAIKIRYGTAPTEPSSKQLELIKLAVDAVVRQKRPLSDEVVAEIVYRYCPGAGHYGYHGLDNADLITLLMLAIKR